MYHWVHSIWWSYNCSTTCLVGIVSMLYIIVIIISVTGLLLNHNTDLTLDKKRISNSWLFMQYNMNPDIDAVISYPIDNQLLSYASGILFLDENQIGEIHDNVDCGDGEVNSQQLITNLIQNHLKHVYSH